MFTPDTFNPSQLNHAHTCTHRFNRWDSTGWQHSNLSHGTCIHTEVKNVCLLFKKKKKEFPSLSTTSNLGTPLSASSVLQSLGEQCKCGQMGCNSGPSELGSICRYCMYMSPSFPLLSQGPCLTLIKQILRTSPFIIANSLMHQCLCVCASVCACIYIYKCMRVFVWPPRGLLSVQRGADVGRLILVWRQNHAREEGSLITHLTSHLQPKHIKENAHTNTHTDGCCNKKLL